MIKLINNFFPNKKKNIKSNIQQIKINLFKT